MERLNDIQKWTLNLLHDGSASMERLCDILVDNAGQLIDEGLIEFNGDGTGDPFQADLSLTDEGDKAQRAVLKGEL